MRECPDVLEADMARFYGIDLWRALYGGGSVRRLSNLAANLPPEALVWGRIDEDALWSRESALLAMIHNDIGEFMYAMGCFRKGQKPKRIGPSYIAPKAETKSIKGRSMSIEKMRELVGITGREGGMDAR